MESEIDIILTNKSPKKTSKFLEAKVMPKSNDNIASILRRQVVLSNSRQSVNHSPYRYSKIPIFLPIQKSSSVQVLSPAHTEKLKTQKLSNNKQPASKNGNTQRPKSVNIKRAFSSQNMSTPPQEPKKLSPNAVAYNAELLSNFEKEKKLLEEKIVQLKCESQAKSAELLRLKDICNNKREDRQWDEMMEEIQLLRQERDLLKQQLRQNGVPPNHYTDNEKIILLQSINREDEMENSFTYSDPVIRDASRSSFDDLATPSWGNLDRHSSFSVDRGLNAVNVLDLRERLFCMQEVHFSTKKKKVPTATLR